eukprot:TRINITY_DN3015_c0_g2_i1.p2 TRINITY_DN3015_c0_g2~~TRINITY_DN3015_c0_g2_i1.p2  ORF type:complete len:763 (+),score=291.23 TRINITY_DN3015_c0_g2_i1:86-2374(+)
MGKKARAMAKAKAATAAKTDDDVRVEDAPAAEGASSATTAPAMKGGALSKTGAVTNFSPPKYEENARNIKVDQLDINYHGHHVMQDARLELVQGRRYAIIGQNGCGKSTLMNVLGAGEIDIPPKLDYFHLKEEVASSEESVLDCVMKVDTERERLEAELEDLQGKEDEEEAAERFDFIYQRLDELEADTAETRACQILAGLGFDHEMQQRPTRSYSGGWRMRVALAQVLFLRPSFMMLDEPTNHLDIEAVVWLESYLRNFKGILLMVSHSQDFMNNICTHIIHMSRGRLMYYAGNYDQYVITKMEKEENQMKRFQWEQGQIKSMKDYIARFGHGSKKLARQAQSKEKTLAKMVRGGLTERIDRQSGTSFMFPCAGELPSPLIKFEDVSFKYPIMKENLYNNIELGVGMDSHICIVGPNGAGKTTLQKLITGELEPTDGYVHRNGHCTVARFHQHFVDQLDMDLSPLMYMRKEYPEITSPEQMRAWIGRFGLTGAAQTSPIGTLSDGQKSRVVLAWMAQRSPHILLLDEPTNHLDMESIDALAEALNWFEGAVILISHDMRLIAQVASEIWTCENGYVKRFPGDIADYKEVVEKRVAKAQKAIKDHAGKASYKDLKEGTGSYGGAAQTAPAPRAGYSAKPAPKGKKAKPKSAVPQPKAAPVRTMGMPPKGAEMKLELKKARGQGLGIELDSYEHEDQLVVVLDDVSEGGIAEKHGWAGLVGCRITQINGTKLKTLEDLASSAREAKDMTSVFMGIARRPDDDE